MKRHLTQSLIEWKNSPYRKPLLIQGARQVGKTYLINEFGHDHYENTVYFNFETDQQISDIFIRDLHPDRLLTQISYLSGQTIVPGKTLIIFDEIQACEAALTSLKYFNEEANQIHIIATGSFLSIAMTRKHYSFPVGKVDMMVLYPMDFKEFLMANNDDYLIEQIETSYLQKLKLAEPIHLKALDLYHQFLVVGGMPAAVKLFIETQNYDLVRNEQNRILDNYLMDMAKYSSPLETRKTRSIYASMVSQLTKENKKFQYSKVKSGSGASDFEGSMEWLTLSSVIMLCHKIKTPSIPAKAYMEFGTFKAYLSDCGLLCAQSNLRYDLLLNDSPLITQFKGGLVENAVFNQLCVNGIIAYYWTSEGIAEVDFILDLGEKLIPIEVKSGIHVHSKSLNRYIDLYHPDIALRISQKNFGDDPLIQSIPLYAVFCIKNS